MTGMLFIDDEEGVRRSVVRALKKEPYRVVAVSGGRQAIAWARRHPSSLAVVISDYKMPGIDGLETLAAIARIKPEVARIILTGYASVKAAVQATNAGIDGFLTKPFDNVQLRAHIREILVRKRLRQFVSPQIYEEIRAAPEALVPRHHEVTVLFSDIRNFTAMTRCQPPATVARFLNDHYFGPMGEIAFANDGMVDKHLGDGMMVVFGTPLPRPDDARRALRTALAMQRAAQRIDAGLAGASRLRLQLGIGISTGKVYSGVLGSFRKQEYTCIGEAVNVAARLQSRARPGQILFHERTLARITHGAPLQIRGIVSMPPMQLKGLPPAMQVYCIQVRPPGAAGVRPAPVPAVAAHA